MSRSKYICIALNSDLLKSVTSAAVAMHISRAAYIRYALAKELNVQKDIKDKQNSLQNLFKKYVDEED